MKTLKKYKKAMSTTNYRNYGLLYSTDDALEVCNSEGYIRFPSNTLPGFEPNTVYTKDTSIDDLEYSDMQSHVNKLDGIYGIEITNIPQFIEALKFLMTASKEAKKYYFEGVFIYPLDEKPTLIATDSYRMHTVDFHSLRIEERYGNIKEIADSKILISNFILSFITDVYSEYKKDISGLSIDFMKDSDDDFHILINFHLKNNDENVSMVYKLSNDFCPPFEAIMFQEHKISLIGKMPTKKELSKAKDVLSILNDAKPKNQLVVINNGKFYDKSTDRLITDYALSNDNHDVFGFRYHYLKEYPEFDIYQDSTTKEMNIGLRAVFIKNLDDNIEFKSVLMAVKLNN